MVEVKTQIEDASSLTCVRGQAATQQSEAGHRLPPPPFPPFPSLPYTTRTSLSDPEMDALNEKMAALGQVREA